MTGGKKAIITASALVLAAAAVAVTVIAVDERITVRTVGISSDKVDGEVRLLHLSDLHSSLYGEGQSKLLSKIEQLSPDAILLTGDIYENRITNEKPLMEVRRKYTNRSFLPEFYLNQLFLEKVIKYMSLIARCVQLSDYQYLPVQ